MKICILQAAYPKDHLLREHDEYPNPGLYVSQHEFHHRFVEKVNFRKQIDDAVGECFDFFFSFLWGQPEDEVAGIQATEYLESLRVPFIGLRSHILRKSKTAFCKAARKNGSPPVPSDDTNRFPLMVKPARSCASQFINDRSLCFTAIERDAAIVELDRQLQPGRARGEQNKSPDGKGRGLSAKEGPRLSIDNLPSDIIVQAFIPGRDCSVVVVEFGDTPVALNPTFYRYPPGIEAGADSFLTFDIKFHPELIESLMKRQDNPALFDLVQKLAIEAFEINGMKGSSWGNVDFRITPEGQPIAIEVNPMPAVFLPESFGFEDTVIRHSLPGEHRALVNIMLASYFKQSKSYDTERQAVIRHEYDRIAPNYDSDFSPLSTVVTILGKLLARFDFDGSLLDLACGTGVVGQMIRAKQQQQQQHISAKAPISNNARHVGLDISPEMARLAKAAGYDEVIVGSMQNCLPEVSDMFDHVFCYQAIHFVSIYEVSLVLTRSFLIAKKSVTIGVDEIPDEYNERIKALPPPINKMTSINHLQEIEAFGVPRGWKLAMQERSFGWASPATGARVYTNLFHYERLTDESVAVMAHSHSSLPLANGTLVNNHYSHD